MSRAPFKLPAFRRLIGAYAVNQAGDWAAEVALAILVFDVTANAGAVAATWLVHRCLLGVAAPLLVARFDRHRLRRLLPALFLAQAAIFVALALVGRSVGLAGVLALVALDGLLAPTARALARSALVATTRPAGMLEEGNAVINTVFTANAMLAPALGGVLVALVDVGAALAFNAVTFAVAAAVLGLGELPQHVAAGEGASPGALQRMRDAVAYVRGEQFLGLMLVADAVICGGAVSINPLEVALVQGELGASSFAFGAVLAVGGIGLIVGGALVGALRRRLGVGVVLGVASGVQMTAMIGMGLSGSVAEIAPWACVAGLGNGLYAVLAMTVIQQRTSDTFQVRVGALTEALITVATGCGFFVGGVLAATAGPRAAFVVAGIAGLVAVAVTVHFATRFARTPLPPSGAVLCP